MHILQSTAMQTSATPVSLRFTCIILITKLFIHLEVSDFSQRQTTCRIEAFKAPIVRALNCARAALEKMCRRSSRGRVILRQMRDQIRQNPCPGWPGNYSIREVLSTELALFPQMKPAEGAKRKDKRVLASAVLSLARENFGERAFEPKEVTSLYFPEADDTLKHSRNDKICKCLARLLEEGSLEKTGTACLYRVVCKTQRGEGAGEGAFRAPACAVCAALEQLWQSRFCYFCASQSFRVYGLALRLRIMR